MAKNITLPDNVVISNEEMTDDYVAETVADWIDNYLSDKYGFCVGSYGWTIRLEVSSITWDTKLEEEED